MIPLSFYMGVYSSWAMVIRYQSMLIENQKDLKKSLENQVEYVKSLDEAFDKTVEMERPEKK